MSGFPMREPQNFFEEHWQDDRIEREFELGVATTPAGNLLGLPIVSWDDGTTVIFELKDLISKAYELRSNI